MDSGPDRYAIVTPYYKEDRALLERCIGSVQNQSIRVEHLVVADGFPQQWLDDYPVRHFKLDRSHGDFGNAPRGIGALIAIAEDFAGIGFLDADNWLDPNHVESCLSAARASEQPCDYVIAKRRFLRPDGTVMPIGEEPNHVDTNCFFFLRGAFSVIPHWAMMPKQMSSLGDRTFHQMIAQRPFNIGRVAEPTVNYECLWKSLYEVIGETPPQNAKPSVDHQPYYEWLRSLSPRDMEIVRRLTGINFSDSRSMSGQNSAIGRNVPCPCGSGKRFKHCHGALT